MIKLNFSNLTRLTILLVITYWGIDNLVVNGQLLSIGTVTVISDDVYYKKSSSKDWTKLKKESPNQPLFSKDSLRISKTGKAKIRCVDQYNKKTEWPLISGSQVVGVNTYCKSAPPGRGSVFN